MITLSVRASYVCKFVLVCICSILTVVQVTYLLLLIIRKCIYHADQISKCCFGMTASVLGCIEPISNYVETCISILYSLDFALN